MRFLGIDFGSKRVGIAVSDQSGTFASPVSVLPNDKNLLTSVAGVISERNITAVVMGESKDFAGKDNAIMPAIHAFKKALEQKTGLPVFLEPEFMTSAEAERPPARGVSNPERKTKMKKNKNIDASAAALILQYYLDKHQAKP